MDALLRRIGRRLVDDIEATIESWAPDQIDVAALGRLFQRAYADERAARLALWLSLAGWRPKGTRSRFAWRRCGPSRRAPIPGWATQ